MIIKVTEEHIKNGQRKRSHFCPVTLAAKSLGCFASTGRTTIEIRNTRYRLPEEVSKRIIQFDEQGFMEPFEFELGTKDLLC